MRLLISIVASTTVSMTVFAMLLLSLCTVMNELFAIGIASAMSVASIMIIDHLLRGK
jgi:hypothetical protein